VKLAGGINAYQYVPNPTGWVDPLGLSANCPPKGRNQPTCQILDEPDAPDISRKGAFRQAKRDAGIPMMQRPDMMVDPDNGWSKQYTIEKMTDKNQKTILDENGREISTKVYQFTRQDGSKVIIQTTPQAINSVVQTVLETTYLISTYAPSRSLEKATFQALRNITHSGSKNETLERIRRKHIF
jgi:uncharacterized protein RhaS with RHS repeats